MSCHRLQCNIMTCWTPTFSGYMSYILISSLSVRYTPLHLSSRPGCSMDAIMQAVAGHVLDDSDVSLKKPCFIQCNLDTR
jgi:hypothetical protein